MRHPVPVARRNLFADRRRLAASVAGVGLALMLILLLDGLWTGLQAQVAVYENRTGADLFVAQPGTRNLLGDTSIIPISTLAIARGDRDVDWAAPVRGGSVILELHGHKSAAFLIGSVPGRRGGPWALRTGREARTTGEAVVDDVIARRHGLRVGDALDVMDGRFRIVGISRGASAFMFGFVFITHDAADALLHAPGTTSYVLIGTRHPGAVRRRLSGHGLNVLTRDVLVASDRALLTKIFGVPIRLMVAVAFAAGTLIIALTAYTSVVERRREYGIAKAMGARARFLIATAARQTLALGGLGLVAGGALFWGGRALIVWRRPQFLVALTAGSVVRTLVAALAMSLLASIVPARRLAAIEPASAYRGGS